MSGRHYNNNARENRGGIDGIGMTRNTNTTNRIKTTIEHYCFYVGSSKEASDYETTTELVINHVKKTL